MKKKENFPKIEQITLEEMSGYFQNGKEFKIGRKVLRPAKGKARYPCQPCRSLMILNNIHPDVIKVVCRACFKADEKTKFNWNHYIEEIL